MKKINKKLKIILLEVLEISLVGIGVFVLAYLFLGQFLEISGDSMLPNFRDKEQLIAEKVSIKYEKPKRGEIVIFRQPQNSGKLVIKRVVGLPGEKIRIENGLVYINGKQLKEPYLESEVITKAGIWMEEGFTYKVGEKSYILLGDNRTNSTDSRDWGEVPEENIVGRAILVYYPLKSFRLVFQQH